METVMNTQNSEYEILKQGSLAHKTKLYWELSLAKRHKGPLKEVATERALALLNGIEAGLDDITPLKWRTADLINRIIGIKAWKAKQILEEGLAKTRLRGYTPTQATRMQTYVNTFGRNPDGDDDGPRAA